MLQCCSGTPYIAQPGITLFRHGATGKMAKAFGLINAFALLAGTMSLVLWG